MQETRVRSLGWEDSLEEGMATHSSILAWRILWTEEPGGLQSTGSQSDLAQGLSQRRRDGGRCAESCRGSTGRHVGLGAPRIWLRGSVGAGSNPVGAWEPRRLVGPWGSSSQPWEARGPQGTHIPSPVSSCLSLRGGTVAFCIIQVEGEGVPSSTSHLRVEVHT